MSRYCEPEDALNWVTHGSVTNPRRLVSEVVPSTDTIVLEDHRLQTASPVQLWLRNGEMPAPLVEGTVNYAIRLSDSTFKVAVSVAQANLGNAINITSEGSNVHLVVEIPWDAIIERNSALLDEIMIGSAMPIDVEAVIPPIVKRLCSLLVISEVMLFVGKEDEGVDKHLAKAWELLDKYMAGKPIRVDAPEPTNLAVRRPALSGSAGDPRGWRRSCGGSEVLP